MMLRSQRPGLEEHVAAHLCLVTNPQHFGGDATWAVFSDPKIDPPDVIGKFNLA
jgi:hypothetical protein